jgi:glycosyltransferase involved in cell wall biosynthesis
MKVLWLSQNLPYPPKTGVLQRNYNLIREASAFAEVHLVAIVKQDILPTFDEQVAARELAKFCATVTSVYLPIEQSRARFLWLVVKNLFTTTPFTAKWAVTPALRQAIVQAVSRGPYDVVFFDTISLAPYRDLVNGSPTALNHHNIESHLLERRVAYEQSALRRFYFALESRKLRRYEAAVAGDFDTNLVVSRLDGERLQEICPRVTTAVLANGVDVEYFRRQSPTTTVERGHLIMVSGMNWFPNRDAVLLMAESIWPELTKVMPDARLTIVGASPPHAILNLAARDRRVTVTGFVDDVRPYMERAQVYLCPMRDGGGTRLKILDALAMGVPIVATQMALEGIDVVAESDVLVADAPGEFVNQVVRLVGDRTLWDRLHSNGRAFVERHFAWPVIRQEMEAAFRSSGQARQPHA